MVAPWGPLTALPFHLLVTEKPAAATPETPDGYRDAAWLLKRHAVSVLPSVASLKALRAFARKDPAVKPMTGFGDPVRHSSRQRCQRDHSEARASDYRIVYFATHGLVAGDVEGVAEPSLAPSMPSAPSDLDDGLLAAACNTIAGDKPGAEALRQAMLG
jgi:hypothetical protein